MRRILEFDKDEGSEFRIALDSMDLYTAVFEIHELCFKELDNGDERQTVAKKVLDIIRERVPSFLELEG